MRSCTVFFSCRRMATKTDSSYFFSHADIIEWKNGENEKIQKTGGRKSAYFIQTMQLKIQTQMGTFFSISCYSLHSVSLDGVYVCVCVSCTMHTTGIRRTISVVGMRSISFLVSSVFFFFIVIQNGSVNCDSV